MLALCVNHVALDKSSAPSEFCDVMFRQTAYAASVTMNQHDLLFHQLAKVHEDRGDLGAGDIRLRTQLAVRTLNQALTDGSLHRGDGPRADVGSVRKLGQILRERNRFEAVLDRVAEQYCDELFARNRAGHIRAVQTRQNGHDHAARGIRAFGENWHSPVPFIRPLSTT